MATTDSELLGRLPAEVARALAPVLGDRKSYDGPYEAALAAVAYPEGDVYPLPGELTPSQRALAELAARHAMWARGFAMPTKDQDPERWLGLVPPGPLEQPFAMKRDGKTTNVPLWYALQSAKARAAEDGTDQDEVVAKLLGTLPIAERLDVYVDMYSAAHDHAYELDPSGLLQSGLRLLEDLGPKTAAWAVRTAGAVLAREAASKAATPAGDWVWRAPLELRLPIFAGLVRGNVPIEPRYDLLLPIRVPQHQDLTLECIRAIPEERRARAILAALERGNAWEVHRDGRTLLPEFPSAELTKAVLVSLEASDDRKKPFLDSLKELGKEHHEVAAAIAEHLGKKLPAIELGCLTFEEPRALADLDATQQEQLCICGKRWDGKSLPASARIGDDKRSEASFRSTLEFRTLGKDKPLYDAFSYAGDSGTVFKTGTTTVVAEIVQGSVECKSAPLKDALEDAVTAKPKAKAKAKPKAKPKRR